MKINSKVINIPPFISTSWDNILSLYMKDSNLVIILSNEITVQVPGLAPSTVELIFAAHAAYLDEASKPEKLGPMKGNLLLQALTEGEESGAFPLRFGYSTLDGIGGALQHDPSQAAAAPIPDEILNKIVTIAKIVGGEEGFNFPKGHPGCNCTHCQICRAISGDSPDSLPTEEATVLEEAAVLEEELRFRDWEIVQISDKLYEVSSPLDQRPEDKKERYRVFLGEPMGCTCGQNGCEHLLAVLKS